MLASSSLLHYHYYIIITIISVNVCVCVYECICKHIFEVITSSAKFYSRGLISPALHLTLVKGKYLFSHRNWIAARQCPHPKMSFNASEPSRSLTPPGAFPRACVVSLFSAAESSKPSSVVSILLAFRWWSYCLRQRYYCCLYYC